MEAEKVVVGVLRLSLMSGEADFDDAKFTLLFLDVIFTDTLSAFETPYQS